MGSRYDALKINLLSINFTSKRKDIKFCNNQKKIINDMNSFNSFKKDWKITVLTRKT